MDGIFGKRFDLDGDGRMSVPERMADFAVFSHFMDEIDAEGDDGTKASRRESNGLDFCGTSDGFITKDPRVATDGDFVVDDKDYYAILFADVDDMDDLDNEDDLDDLDDFDDEDELDDEDSSDDGFDSDYYDEEDFEDDYRDDDDGFAFEDDFRDYSDDF